MKKVILLTFTALMLTTIFSACGDSSATPAGLPLSSNSTQVVPGSNSDLQKTATTAVATPSNPVVQTSLANTATPIPSPTPVPAHVVVIDPGHGGIDWGTFHTTAAGKIDLKEKDAALQLGLKTAEFLRAAGFTVILTRTDDKYFNDKDYNGDGKIDGFDDLQARVNIANANKGELFFSIHTNSSNLKNKVGGVETWYGSDRPFTAQNKRFAQLIQQHTVGSLKSVGYDALDRGANDDLELDKTGDHIFVLGPMTRNHKSVTEMPGALTEVLFITNDTEAALLQDPKTISVISDGYAQAIKEYFNQPAS